MRMGVAALARLRGSCTRELKRSVFNALVASHASYMLTVYGGITKDLLKRVEVLQKRAVKVAMGLPHLTPSRERA